MAARQQPRGTSLEVQYKDFDPKFEWKDQPEATLFTIDLPGFTKEQIKVSYVHASKMIRVTGERPLARKKWSRFNKVFTVPQNCLVNKIHGAFDNNSLTITMPKETIRKMPNLPEASKTVAEKVEKLKEKKLLEEGIRKEKQEEAEKKTKLLEEKEGILRKLQEEAKAREMVEARKLQEAVTAKERDEARKLQEEAKEKEMDEARKLQEEAVIAKERAEARRLQETAIAKERSEARRLQEEVQKKEMAEARKIQEGALAKEKVDAIKLQEEDKAKEKLEVRMLPELDYTNPGPGKASEAVKSAEEKLSYMMVKEKLSSEEKKKLMVNVGVAILVIVALGAYVS